MRVLQPVVEILEVPLLAFMRLERGGVIDAFMGRDLVADHAVEVRADHRRAALVEAVAHLAKAHVLLAFGGIGLIERENEFGARVGRLLFFAVCLVIGPGNLEAGFLRRVLLVGDVDDRSRAKEQKQCHKHRHGDFVEVVVLHRSVSPQQAEATSS